MLIDSDGKTDPLLPLWLESGFDIVFPIEVGTWRADPTALRKRYDRGLRMMGGVDKRVIPKGAEAIRRHLGPLVPPVVLVGQAVVARPPVVCCVHRSKEDAMGLFDTILFPKPIPCIGCSAPQESTQSHELGETLDTYGVGDVVAGCPVVTGILEERLYCGKCQRSDQKVFITIWHCLITGIFEDQDEAERRLLDVDRADILNHLIRHQKEERRLQRLLHSALNVVCEYAEYVKAEDKEKFFRRPFGAISLSGLKEHLQTEDPLAGIVAHFRAQMGTSGQGHGIFS